MAKIKCLRTYRRPRIGTLGTFAQNVADGIFNNPLLFAVPPMTLPIFQAIINNYLTTWAAYSVGGIAQQGAYRTAQTALITALDTLALFVDETADGLESTITTSGFLPTKGTPSIGPEPTQLQDIVLTRGVTRTIIAECENQDAAAVYICILTEGAPLPPNFTLNDAGQMTINGGSSSPSPSSGIIDFSKGRRKTFINLTVGVNYYFVFFVINARGVGPMSLPVSILCA